MIATRLNKTLVGYDLSSSPNDTLVHPTVTKLDDSEIPKEYFISLRFGVIVSKDLSLY